MITGIHQILLLLSLLPSSSFLLCEMLHFWKTLRLFDILWDFATLHPSYSIHIFDVLINMLFVAWFYSNWWWWCLLQRCWPLAVKDNRDWPVGNALTNSSRLTCLIDSAILCSRQLFLQILIWPLQRSLGPLHPLQEHCIKDLSVFLLFLWPTEKRFSVIQLHDANCKSQFYPFYVIAFALYYKRALGKNWPVGAPFSPALPWPSMRRR